MTEQDRQDDRDDLELEAETVKDLEPNQEAAEDVVGGATRPNLGSAGTSHST
jgi:hypothetical protein